MSDVEPVNRRPSAALRAGLLLASLVFLAWALPAHAAPVFTVIEPSDAPDANLDGTCASTDQGLCTLRAAVQEAEFAGGGEVVLSAGLGPFQLTIPGGSEIDPNAAPGANAPNAAVGDLDISKNVTITGLGPSESVIDGTNTTRIFDVHAGGVLQIKDVRLENGKADYDSATGHSHGGAIHNHGTVNLVDTVVDDSTAAPSWGGGGITNASNGTATMDNVTVAKNSAPLRGGGIENLGTLSMTNVTVADNTAPTGTGGGVYAGGTTNLTNTLVAQNASGGDCLIQSGAVVSGAYNLAGDGSCGFAQATDHNGSPGFEGGVPGGGPLFYALSATSQAVDAGSPQTCPATDIRGVARPQDGDGDGVARCDIGSYERERAAQPPAAQPSLSISGATVKEGDSGTKNARLIVTLSAPATQTVTVRAATSDETARAGSDYRAKSSTVTFDVGDQSAVFKVKVIGDRRKERNETFKVKLSSPTNAAVAVGHATGTILNDD